MKGSTLMEALETANAPGGAAEPMGPLRTGGPGEPADSPAERDVKQAAWRGWRRRCPACGTGPMMKGYLSTRSHCTVCGETLSHHRADDGPAYLTILIVGHLMAPLLGITYMVFRPEPLVLFTLFATGTVALSLWLLPRLKGMMVGFQWAKRMHGFGEDPDGPEP